MGLFQTTADLPMKARAPLRRDARIHHLPEEVVAEAIARRQRPVRPRRHAFGGEKLALTRPGGATRLDLLFRQGCCGDYGGDGERVAGYARHLENGLLLARQLFEAV